MTNERITEIKALCAAATPGPWTYRRIDGSCFNEVLQSNYYEHVPVCNAHPDDANFIAAARQIVPELLEALECSMGDTEAIRTFYRKLSGERDYWQQYALNLESELKKATENV